MISSVEVHARRWFQRSYGNTYHTVRVVAFDENGQELLDVVSDQTYGYGEHYLHTAATLLSEAMPDLDPYEFNRTMRTKGIVVTKDVIDVKRMRELH